MRLGAWLRQQQEMTGRPAREILGELSKNSGVTITTLDAVARGALMGFYKKARAISEATGWVVTILDLCDEHPEETAGRIVYYQEHR